MENGFSRVEQLKRNKEGELISYDQDQGSLYCEDLF